MSQIPAAMAVAASAHAIDRDFACVRCGYNLRGLNIGGLCPECGTPVGQSLHGNLLKYSDPEWIRNLRLGALLLLWNILVNLLAQVGAVIVANVGLPEIIAEIIAVLASVFGLSAVILLTSQEPRVSLIEEPITLRRVIRSCAGLALLADVCLVIGPYIGLQTVLAIPAIVSPLAWLLMLLGMFVYSRRFAQRMAKKKLVQSTTAVMWGYVVGFVLLVLVGVLSLTGFAPSLGGGAAAELLLVVALSAGVLLFLCSIGYLIILFQYNRAFKEVWKQAQIQSRVAPRVRLSGIPGPVIASLNPGRSRKLAAAPSTAAARASQTGPADRASGGTAADHFARGVALTAEGRLEEAAGAYRQVLRFDPGHAEAHNNLANVLLKLGMPDEALEHLNDALRLRPDLAPAHFNRGNILFRQGRMEAAIETYRQALALQPGLAIAHNNLAIALEQTGRFAEAAEEFRRVLAIEPQHSQARQRLEAVLNRG